jgi:hypothetical protein
VRFYVGLHRPNHGQHFDRAFISINTIRDRRSPFAVKHWVLDSGAFTELKNHGQYRHTVAEYARDAARWIGNGELDAIVAQDYMCEPFMLERTGLTVADHQRLTIERYDELLTFGLPVTVMPVLQGYSHAEYLAHLDSYGDRLAPGAWVGVGSVCKRQGRPESVLRVLLAIHAQRPDLRLHGFGVKATSLAHPGVRHELFSADSMAWSYAARMEGRNPNDWHEAERFRARVERFDYTQPTLEFTA